MSVVYLGEHVHTGRRVALKTVRLARPGELWSIRREIHTLTGLRHPGVVQFLDGGVDHGRPWYAMELIDGQNLATLRDTMYPNQFRSNNKRARVNPHTQVGELDDNADGSYELGEDGFSTTLVPDVSDGSISYTFARSDAPNLKARMAAPPRNPQAHRRRLPHRGLNSILSLFLRLCSPLAFIHSRGLVHRDLTPGNIVIRRNGAPVLVDFGLVSRFHLEDGRARLSAYAGFRGTPAYMSPEQIRSRAVDARTDFYAIGCMLYEFTIGRHPFVGDTLADILEQHLYVQVAPPSAYVDGLPERLEQLILQLLSKRPRDRIGHADDLAAVLRELGAHSDDEVVSSSYLFRPAIVGRSKLQDTLQDHLDQTLYNRGRWVVLEGESGVGKTSLAMTLAVAASQRSVRVVTGECARQSVMRERQVGGPLHPFQSLFEVIANFCLTNGPEATDRLLGERVNVLRAYAPILGTIPGVDAYPQPAELPAEAARARIISMLVDTLSAFIDEQPLLLIIDDLQWADPISLEILQSLERSFFSTRPLLLLGIHRAEEATPALQALLERTWIERVKVGRLGSIPVSAMVADMLGMRSPPRAMLKFLVKRSGGNPLFVVEYLRSAVAQGILQRQQCEWRVDDGDADRTYDSLPLPGSLHTLMERRLDRVSGHAQALLEFAAVLGREFSVDLLLDGATCGDEQDFDAVNELLERDLLEHTTPARVRFVHDKLREATYQKLPVAERVQRHRQAALAIERRHGDEVESPLWLPALVHHWSRAGDDDKALHYLDHAGSHALAVADCNQAVELLERAIALHESLNPGDLLPRARWHRQIGEAYLGLNLRTQSREHLQRALAILGSPVPASQKALALSLSTEIGVQLWRRYIPQRVQQSLRKMDIHASEMSESAWSETALALHLLHKAARTTGDVPLIMYTMLRALNIAERGASWSVLAMSYSLAEVVAGAIPARRLAHRYESLAHDALTHVDDLAVRSWVLHMTGVYALGEARWHRLLDDQREAARIAQQIGYIERWMEAQVVIGFGHYIQAEYDHAMSALQAVAERCLPGAERLRLWAYVSMAWVALRRGDIGDAAAQCASAGTFLDDDSEASDRLSIVATMAVSSLRNGAWSRSWRQAENAFEVLQSLPTVMFEILGAVSMLIDFYGEMYFIGPIGYRSRIVTRLRAMVKRCKASTRAFPHMEPDYWYWSGVLAWIEGKPGKARRHWSASLDRASSMNMGYHIVRARLALARGTLESRERSMHLALARERAQSTGLVLDGFRL